MFDVIGTSQGTRGELKKFISWNSLKSLSCYISQLHKCCEVISMIGYIYHIVCKNNDKHYIGMTANLSERIYMMEKVTELIIG